MKKKGTPGNYDPNKIDVTDDLELSRWSDKLDVTKVRRPRRVLSGSL